MRFLGRWGLSTVQSLCSESPSNAHALSSIIMEDRACSQMNRLLSKTRLINLCGTEHLKSRVQPVSSVSKDSPLTAYCKKRASEMSNRRVAIVGAGAAGLCAARHIMAHSKHFASPVVFEQTETVGGTWFYEDSEETQDSRRHVHSSMYRNLRTNLPKEVMMFPDFPFDAHLPSFLPHQDVQKYLERYCEHFAITPHIKFNTAVEEARPIAMEMDREKTMAWEVTTRDQHGTQNTETFDSVFICTGHYSDPHIPPIPGLQYFKGKVMHSHAYRRPEPFAGQSVIVFGAGASGLDISIELAKAMAQVMLSHGKPALTFSLPPGIQQAPPLSRVIEDGRVQFKDGSLVEAEVLMFCTGYNFSFPFLHPEQLHLDIRDHLVAPLYRFILPPAYPSLFFFGICKTICPFPHFHCQVQFALAVLDGTVKLPSREEMEREVQNMVDRKTAMGVLERHLLRMESEQWRYYQCLADSGGFSPLPPVIQSLYEEVARQRQKHPQKYRNANYRLVTDTQWESIEKTH
ncbi:flavin-containing monooxygenase FMO GS-OX-like 4 isoform X1 [Clupea harengus]|uniref:Flavin-containing monooxygenase n=2 Tax=Clupea harengus TaxID=7950 RepID=A0A8M1KEG1_CLUHA|nr:flavin-containing monooxygenase FMO GS-OX-like 4 isoform X1 [Clupea harengus]XP_042562442.1 flavin-containing monooxygenase FMO GS-OX-like 4 isoform X1 [Clupea harengus]